MKDILIIIIVYNPDEGFLSKISFPEYNYLIIDNSETHLALNVQNLPNAKYIKNPSNFGIAKALNIGAEYAIQKNYKWILTMDQDSIFETQVMDSMWDFINNYSDLEKLAILSPRHKLQDNVMVKVSDSSLEYSEGINTMTSGNLLNLSIWQKIAGFNNELFIDMVDIDYYCRAIIAGYKVITLKNVYMQHNLGELRTINFPFKKLKVFNHNYLRKYYQVRNGLFVYFKYRKQIPEVKLVIKFILNLFVALPFEKNRLQKFRFLMLGIYHFLRHKLGKLNV